MSIQTNDLFEGAILKHYKGLLYRFLHYAKHTDDQQEVIVYQALYGNNAIWVRNRDEFFGEVIIENATLSRFALADENYYLILDPALVRVMEENNIEIKDALIPSNEKAEIKYTILPSDDVKSVNKELTTLLIVGSAVGLIMVIKSITSLIRTLQQKPKVIAVESLEPLIEDGKIMKDEAGQPIWIVKKEHQIIEFTQHPEKSEINLQVNAKGFVLKFKNDTK